MMDGSTAPACPYCHTVLEQLPHWKEKCPACGRYILARGGRLVTEDDAQAEDWLARLVQFNIARSDFESYRLALSERLGHTASIHATVRRVLNAQISKGQDPDMVHRACVELIRLASEEGQDPKSCLAQAQKIEQETELKRRRATFRRDMRAIRSLPSVEYVQVQTCKDEYVCPACKVLASMRYRVSEIPELPYEKCESEGGCRCSVWAVTPPSRDDHRWWRRLARWLAGWYRWLFGW